jgi:hypothetical protein
MSEDIQLSQDVPPITIAFVIDDHVVDMIKTDERLASIFLSNPKIIDITNDRNFSEIQVGTEYHDETGFYVDGEPTNYTETTTE